jgi:hypothetical protein
MIVAAAVFHGRLLAGFTGALGAGPALWNFLSFSIDAAKRVARDLPESTRPAPFIKVGRAPLLTHRGRSTDRGP